MTTYVILNGPPKSGKTAMSRELSTMFNDSGLKCVIESFAAPMKHFISTALGAKYADMPKDSPVDILAGYSVREFLIDLSEKYMKLRYGQDIYGRLLVHRVLRLSPLPDIVLCDDAGFASEVEALGPNVVLIQVVRPEHDFKGDSRSYLPDPHYTLHNDSTLDELWVHCRTIVEDIRQYLKNSQV